MARLLLVLPLAFAAWISPTPTSAQNRIVVQNFQGPRSSAIRADAVRGLRGQDVAVVPRSDLARTTRRMRLNLRRDRDFARAGRAIDADLFVHGRVRRGRGWHLDLEMRDGETGEVVAERQISARNPRALSSRVRASFWSEISGPLGGASAGPAVASSSDMVFDLEESDVVALDDEAPPPVEEREQAVEDELSDIRRRNLDGELFPTAAPLDDEVVPGLRTDPPFEPEHSPVEARAGLLLLNRNFSYRDDLAGSTRPYTLPVGAALGLGAAYYPGAHFTNGVLAHLGLTFDASHSIGMSTQGPNDVSYPTNDSRWGIGARGRLPLGASELGLSVGFARHGFSVEAAHPSDGTPDIASVSYGQVRIGADTRIGLGDVNLYAGAAYRAVVDTGEISDVAWYPGASAQGFSLDLGIGYRLPLGFEVRADVGTEMYFIDFHASAEDPDAVGGATDRYLGGSLSAVWHMGPTGF
jgi:hypothetical protein